MNDYKTEKWIAVEARTSGWVILGAKSGRVIVGTVDEAGHYGALTELDAQQIINCVNAYVAQKQLSEITNIKLGE